MSNYFLVFLFLFSGFVFLVGLVSLLIRYAFRKDAERDRQANQSSYRSRQPNADIIGYNSLFGE